MGYKAMAEQRIYKLKVDSDFKQLIPPLSKDELQQLEKNILRDGCREPLCVWNNTILDGHNRYAICTHKQITFTIRHIFLKNREEAIAWICANQSRLKTWYLIRSTKGTYQYPMCDALWRILTYIR